MNIKQSDQIELDKLISDEEGGNKENIYDGYLSWENDIKNTLRVPLEDDKLYTYVLINDFYTFQINDEAKGRDITLKIIKECFKYGEDFNLVLVHEKVDDRVKYKDILCDSCYRPYQRCHCGNWTNPEDK